MADQRDGWAHIFATALRASHHAEWSDDTIRAAALICADATVAVLAAWQTERQPPPVAGDVSRVHPETDAGFA